MKRTSAQGIVLLFILSLFGPAAPAQERVALRFSPAVGTQMTYSLTGMVGMDGKNFLGTPLTLDADSRGDMRFLIRTAAPETVRAGLTTSGIDVNVRLPDRSLSQTLRTREGEALDVVFTRTGKVESIRNPEVLAQDAALNFSIPQILKDYFPTLPALPVGLGEVWTESRRLTIPFQGLSLLVEIRVDYVLDNILTTAEGRKALISAAYAVSVSGSKDLGESVGVFEGRGSGTGYLHFLVDRGCFSEYRLDFKTDAAFVMKQGTKRLIEWPFTFSVFAEVILSDLQAPAVPRK